MCRKLLDRRQRGGRVPDSWFERLVERCISPIDLPPWVCQHVVRGDDGAVVGRLDLACPALLLGVEAHSRGFHFGARPEALDEQRDNRLGALGWHIVYVGWVATEAPATVAATIDAIARRRAAQLGISIPWAA